MKRHIDEQNGDNSEPEFCLSMAVETEHNVTGHIDEDRPNQIVYPSAWDSADLRLGIWHGRSARIEKVVDITSMPSGDSEFVEYSFLVRSSTAQVLAGPDHSVSPWDNGHAELNDSDAFVSLAGSQLRGTVLRTPVAWYYADGEMVRVPVRVTFEIQGDGETVRATKHIPRSLIATALAAGSHLFTDATFSPDANPETSTFDGLTLDANNTLSWAGIITATDASNLYDTDATADFRIWAKSSTNNWDFLTRGHFLFDTNSIGAGQSVDSASIDLSVDKFYLDEFDFYANFYSTSPASNTALVNGDHDSVGTTPFSTGKKITTMSTNWTTETWTLNSDGRDAIDVAGVSKFGLAVNYDRENATTGDPTWVASDRSGFVVRLSENGTNIPVLTVEHSAGGGGATYSGGFGNSISLSTGI